ncbi:HNH endonuclease [Streptomyces sp. NPDC102467]|uniref:HNH endonuclease n=1 Tax=Streptomyces sp. NPDC102467 TaxID=3366179 RepID=UPI00381075B3
MGRETFRRQYKFGRAMTYELDFDGDRYDSKAIAGVAHLYSAGTLLSSDDFSGGANTVARRLRALGFTVQEGVAVTDSEQETGPQIVLQPRGGAGLRGPQNFAKSVRRGILLADIRQVLGEHAEALADLYPDGVARLWGATPTAEANNEKVRALRDRRVGDDIYFYTENHFIARARILHLFDSPLVAKEVWGTKQDGATWEHIVALGEVEEFPTRVLAAPILQRINVPAPLRSLTLRSAEDYGRVTELLPNRRQAGPPRTPTAPTAPTAPTQLKPRDLLTQLRSLHTHRRSENGAPSRHQPLSLLWAISRIAAGKPRLVPWSVFHSEVGPLLEKFGLPGSRVTPEYPFWHLRNSGLWEVHGIPSAAGPMPQLGLFNDAQPVAGLTHASADLLKNPLTRLEAVISLCSIYLADVDQRELLNRVGFAGYATADGLLDGDEDDQDREVTERERATGPAARHDVTSSRPIRNSSIVNAVKAMHGHACQVCRTRLQYKRRPYSEAAHIRGIGSPHDGPDEIQNLLCLCPNHHVLFDGLEIYIDDDGSVRRTHSGDSLGRLHLHAGHQIDEAYLQYHRTLCELSKLTSR